MIFKALHSQMPPYMCNLLYWHTPTRTLRSASTTSLVPNQSKTVRYGKRQLIHQRQSHGTTCQILSSVLALFNIKFC